jgi:hypothetical protein
MRINVCVLAVCTEALILSTTGCISDNPAPEAQPNSPQAIESTASNQSTQANSFRDAVNQAMEAAKLAQTAKTSEEWTKVAASWQQSINLMKAVPEASPNYETAQKKAVEYQTNLEYAHQNIRTTANSSPSPSVVALPPHRVSETPLGNGKRIQVDTNNPQLTHDECSRLAANYSPTAGQGGQIVIQKPNPDAPWNGKLLPFCVDNLDGKGVFFNDFYFQ